MIHRYYQDGDKLDVAGLNQITVLLDRSETELTEIGWNCWRAGLDGPPHRHDDKDQVFYITDGEGTVVLGEDRYEVSPGNAVYVPAGLIHQTITRQGGMLSCNVCRSYREGETDPQEAGRDRRSRCGRKGTRLRTHTETKILPKRIRR